MGSRKDVQAMIAAQLPGTIWNSNGPDGSYASDGFTMELAIYDDPAESVSISVRGAGGVPDAVIGLLQRYGWYGIDTSQDEWFHLLPSGQEGWKAFQAYRDHVVFGTRSRA